MASWIATVLAVSLAVCKSFAAKCMWNEFGQKCEFDNSNINYPATSKIQKYVQADKETKACSKKTKDACTGVCTWRKYEGMCDGKANTVAMLYDLTDCPPQYEAYVLGCDKHEEETACKAASKCVWKSEAVSGDATKEEIRDMKGDGTCKKVTVPKRPGRCSASSAMTYCPSLTADVDLMPMFTGMASCYSAADWAQCMTDLGWCSSLQTDSSKLLIANGTDAAQYEVRQMQNACIKEKTCAAYADVWVPLPATLDEYVAEKNVDCSANSDQTTCEGDAACFWSPYENGASSGACKKKKDELKEFEDKAKHPDCVFTKTDKIKGELPDGESARLALYNEKKKCETLEETACASDAACKWDTGKYCRKEDDGKAPNGTWTGCSWADAEERTTGGLAARKESMRALFGQDLDALTETIETCEALTDKASCNAAEMTPAEQGTMSAPAAASANGATQSYGDVGTRGLVASGIAIVALSRG